MHHRLGTGASEKKVTSGCIPGVVSIVLPLRQGRLQERPINWPRDDEKKKSLSGYVCIIGKPSILDLYLDNISPSIVWKILNFLFPRISCKEGLLLDKKNNKRFAVGDFEDVKSLNRKVSFQYILKFIGEFECIACCAFSSIINFQ